MTKFQRKLFNNYRSSTIHSVGEAYSRPSEAKKRAEQNIKYYARKHLNNPRDFRVTYANTFNFGFAYLYDNSDGTIHLQYHTRDHIYDFSLDE